MCLPYFLLQSGMELVILRKGQKRRTWTPEEKSEIVHKHLDKHISLRTLEKEYQADRSMVWRWVKKYLVEGEISFEHKGHPGNPFAALHTSKTLSEAERLRLMVAKQEIENERLKKGYLTEGVGANKQFVTGSAKGMRSSKFSE